MKCKPESGRRHNVAVAVAAARRGIKKGQAVFGIIKN